MKYFSYFILVFHLLSYDAFCIELSADDPIEYNHKDKGLLATGNARLVTEKFSVQSDKMMYSPDKNVALANGNTILTSGHMFALADQLEYGTKDEIIHGENCDVYSHPLIINASKLYIESEYQKLENCTLHFGQPDCFSPNIEANSFEILNFKKIRAKSATFKVGKIPIFYLPAFTFPVVEKPFWLTSDYGAQSNFGFFVRDDFYFCAGQYVKIGGLLDFYTKRGILFGPSVKIEKDSDIEKFFSETKCGFIHDNGSSKVRNSKWSKSLVKRDRFFLESKNIVHLGDRFDAIGQLSWWSDSEVVRDFRPSWYYHNQIPDSFIESTYRGEDYILSGFSRVMVNNFQETLAKIPELHAEMLPKLLFESSLHHRAFINYSRLKGRDRENIKHKLDKFDGYYGIFLPVSNDAWLSLIPLAGVRATKYLNCAGYENYTQTIAQFGFDVNMIFNGRSSYANEVWDMHGLKHTFQPVIQYRHIPHVRDNSKKIPAIEGTSFDTNLPPIDLADMCSVDDIQQQSVIRVGLKNKLQTSSTGYVARDLAKFDIYQDVRLKRNIDKNTQGKDPTLSDTYILMGICPVSWLSWECYGKIDPKKLTLNELTTSINVHDSDTWRASFLTHSIRHDTNQYGFEVSTKLNSKVELKASIRYDAMIKRFAEQKFSIKSMLGYSWNIECFLVIRSMAPRESKCQFHVRLNLIDF